MVIPSRDGLGTALAGRYRNGMFLRTVDVRSPHQQRVSIDR
jgi:hypothetical protein